MSSERTRETIRKELEVILKDLSGMKQIKAWGLINELIEMEQTGHEKALEAISDIEEISL